MTFSVVLSSKMVNWEWTKNGTGLKKSTQSICTYTFDHTVSHLILAIMTKCAGWHCGYWHWGNESWCRVHQSVAIFWFYLLYLVLIRDASHHIRMCFYVGKYVHSDMRNFTASVCPCDLCDDFQNSRLFFFSFSLVLLNVKLCYSLYCEVCVPT